MWTKLDNKGKIGQFVQNWTIRTKLDNLFKIGQFVLNYNFHHNQIDFEFSRQNYNLKRFLANSSVDESLSWTSLISKRAKKL